MGVDITEFGVWVEGFDGCHERQKNRDIRERNVTIRSEI